MLIPPKLGAVAAIAGAGCLLTGTLLHPMSADPADPVAAFLEYAANRHWIASHLSQFVGVALIFIGLAALADTMRSQTTGWMARLGLYFAIAALASAAILQAVDGVALKIMVDGWSTVPADQKPASYWAALAVRQVEIGAAAYMSMLFGVAVFLLAGAVATSPIYPSWLGWLGIAGAGGTVAGGVSTAFTGFSVTTMTISMPFTLLLLAWMVAIGALMWKQGPA